MNELAEHAVSKAVDNVQKRITDFAYGLHYEDLPPEVIRAAKMRIVDTFGALSGGFFGEPCRIARNLAAQMPLPGGATVMGTRTKTTPDMAAFANGVTARHAEINDAYQEGVAHGHPSDTIMPVFAAAEHAQVSGRDYITGVVASYEVCIRISDVFHNEEAFDTTNFACVGTAVAASKLFGLSSVQISHAVSMAAVPNIILKQVRRNNKTMFKAAAAAQAGRAGVFAALLARAGMEGPHMPYEGKAGWCDHVAKERFSLDTWGGTGTPFKILQTRFKMRPCEAGNIACIFAAEKAAPIKSIDDIEKITVEVNKRVKEHFMAGEQQFRNPDKKEVADHSVPCIVAVTLMDGTVTLRSFDDARLKNPRLRALLQKIDVVENENFSQAYGRTPREYHTRVTVTMRGGEKRVGEHRDDPANPPTEAQIEEKFRSLTGDILSVKQTDSILERLWHLEDTSNVAEIPPAFVFD